MSEEITIGVSGVSGGLLGSLLTLGGVWLKGKRNGGTDVALVKALCKDTKDIVVDLGKGQATTNTHLATQTEVLRGILDAVKK